MKKEKKPYQKPTLKKIGNLQDLSQTTSNGKKADGGAFPLDKKMCLTPPSEIEEHRVLLNDKQSQISFQKMIERRVKPGQVILDLGTGSGIHTLFALRAGASKVYAVDSHAVINVAKEVIRDNGFENKVEFIQRDSRDLSLPEKVDGIISNIGFLHSVNDLPDVTSRLLNYNGWILPGHVKISFTPVSVPQFYCENVTHWDQEHFDLNFSAFRRFAASHPQYLTLELQNIMADEFTSDPIDFRSTIGEELSWEMKFDIEKNEICHGLGGWYEFFDEDKCFLSTRPPLELSEKLWSNFLFPFNAPVNLKAGDILTAKIEMHRERIGYAPIWKWSVQLNGEALYEQSSFQAFMG